MFEDTRINSLEVKEDRRQRELVKARERHHKLEGIRLAYEEKKRIRREMRLQRKHQKKHFEHGVITLQSAYRGGKDRERFEVIIGEKRQKVRWSICSPNRICVQLNRSDCVLLCNHALPCARRTLLLRLCRVRGAGSRTENKRRNEST